MTLTLTCERCGFRRQVEAIESFEESMTAAEYALLIHSDGGVFLCGQCQRAEDRPI